MATTAQVTWPRGMAAAPTMPMPELAALGRMHGQTWKKEKNSTSSSFVIPKGEKRPVEPPVVVKQEPGVVVKQEPIDLDERAGTFYEQGAMEVPDFFSDTAPPHKKHKRDKKKKKKHKHKKSQDGLGGGSSGASSSGSNPASPANDLVF